ncbi:hypothetical protein EDD16DRAFT_1471553 [Pisolithus croceorrhizus]|nr:hypothetical protein EDD16DRAFT_1471553 [Pisolithus croceorrhizus]KAI6169641.1 hypothetical protein EDD17DRAFT_1464547 [Pisolithus thermaeus]
MPACCIGRRPRISDSNGTWYYHPELEVPLGRRNLLFIRRIQHIVLLGALSTCRLSKFKWIFDLKVCFTGVDSIPDFSIPVTPTSNDVTANLALPSAGIADLTDDDAEIFDTHEVNCAADLTSILKMVTLRTIEMAYRLFSGSVVAHQMTFHDLNPRFPIKSSKFDMLGLPGELSMVLIIVPYWEVDCGNLQDLTHEGKQSPGSLDMISTSRPPYYSSVLWAVLWDACKRFNCRFFAVTTYNHWTFGNFSSRLGTAQLTEQIEAPVFPHDASPSLQQIAERHQPNVLECLLFWMAAARDPNHRLLRLPPDHVITEIEAFFA